MLRKLIVFLLCTSMLIGCITVTATAETAASSSAITIEAAARMFYAVAGELTLRAHETALADYDGDGEIGLTDATTAFYRTNGIETAMRSLAFEAYLWELADTVSYGKKPVVIADAEALNAFIGENKGFINAMWMLKIDFEAQALLAVPLTDGSAYVAAVTTDENTVNVSLVALPTATVSPRTAYALITVGKEDVIGKSLTVSSHAETTAVSDHTFLPHSGNFKPTGALSREYGVNAHGSGAATVYVSYTVPSSGYDILGLGYIATEDILYVTCDLRIPAPDDASFTVIEATSGSLTLESGVYTGQEVVFCERFSFPTDTIVGEPIAHNVVYESDHLEFYGEDETTAELITSLDALQAAYAEERSGSPDYTVGFDDTYFEDHALILVKPFYWILPYGVTIDEVSTDGHTLHVTVRFTNLDYHMPALYHGRLLVEVDAADVADIDTVVCHTEETFIQTLPTP